MLLLIFLAFFAGLHYVIPASHLFPSINEFVPQRLLSHLKSVNNKNDSLYKVLPDSTKTVPFGTIPIIDSVQVIPEKITNYPLNSE